MKITKDNIVILRLSEVEKEALKKEAKKHGVSMSRYLRDRIPIERNKNHKVAIEEMKNTISTFDIETKCSFLENMVYNNLTFNTLQKDRDIKIIFKILNDLEQKQKEI